MNNRADKAIKCASQKNIMTIKNLTTTDVNGDPIND